MTPRLIRSLAKSNKPGTYVAVYLFLSFAGLVLGQAYWGGNGKVMVPIVCLYLGLFAWFFLQFQKVSIPATIKAQKELGWIAAWAFILILLAFMLGVGAANGFHKRHTKAIAASAH